MEGKTVDGVPMNRYWLAPHTRRLGLSLPNPVMSRERSARAPARPGINFYGCGCSGNVHGGRQS